MARDLALNSFSATALYPALVKESKNSCLLKQFKKIESSSTSYSSSSGLLPGHLVQVSLSALASIV